MQRDYLFVGVQLLLFILYVFDFFPLVIWPTWLYWGAVVVTISGAGLLLIAMLQLSRSLSPFPTPRTDAALVRHGVYSWCRHPIYSGILLITIGYGFVMGSWWKLMIAAALWALFFFKSRYEERLLSERFKAYEVYKENTGRFWPRLIRKGS